MTMTDITAKIGRQTPAAETEADFLAKVGRRVHTTRARKGISRRTLSEASGVSPRYLAQLESGEGNISIALLMRIARALDHRIEWFVGDEDPWNSDVAAVTSLFRQATGEQRAKVLEILDPEHTTLKRARRIALIGLRGAGKSTLGRLAAERLDMPFVEMNREIESSSGMPIIELMAIYGQEWYRRLERQALERIVSTHETVVLAASGGIVADPSTFNYLLRYYHTVWLKATPEEHMARVRAQGDLRPMAGNPAAMEELRSILTSREALYARASAQLSTSGQSVDESLAGLLAVIEAGGFAAA